VTRTDTVRSASRAAPVCLLALLCGCAGVSRGPVDTGTSARADGPRLHADPGVRVERPGQGVIGYRKGMALQTGDVIQTADGYAVIDFGRGNVVDLRPNTRIALGSITLFFGELFARIVDIAAHGGGQVVTDELAASVEGTEYAVRHGVAAGAGTGPGSTAVIVRAGQVRCTPGASGTWPAVVVGANLVFQVENGRVLGPPSPIDAAAETRWADEVERRLLRARPPAYSPPIWRPRGPRPRPTRPYPPPTRPSPPPSRSPPSPG
jgi:hypothetical protein